MRRLALPVLALFPVGMAAAQSVRIPLPGHEVPGPTTAPVQPMAPAWTVLPAGLGRTPANPYGRAIDLTVNVQFFQRDLGELQIHLAADGTATFDAPAIATALKPILSDAGQARLARALAGRQTITPMALKAVGIDAMFNPADVVIDVQAIDPSLRRAVSMFGKDNDEADRATNASPASVSFFLNTGVSETRVWKGAQSGFRHPSVFLNSAARFGPIVVEASGQFADREPSSVNRRFHFDRNFARLVYDRPKQYLRAYFGDLTPEFRFQQNFVQMGGVGVSRQRRRFDDFRSAILQGNRLDQRRKT